MSKMLTRELTGAYLSYKVAEAMGHIDCVVNLQGKCVQPYIKNGVTQYREVDYTNRPEVVLAILKTHGIITCNLKGKKWWACVVDAKTKNFPNKTGVYGSTLEEAVFRCLILKLYGEEVEIIL